MSFVSDVGFVPADAKLLWLQSLLCATCTPAISLHQTFCTHAHTHTLARFLFDLKIVSNALKDVHYNIYV